MERGTLCVRLISLLNSLYPTHYIMCVTSIIRFVVEQIIIVIAERNVAPCRDFDT